MAKDGKSKRIDGYGIVTKVRFWFRIWIVVGGLTDRKTNTVWFVGGNNQIWRKPLGDPA